MDVGELELSEIKLPGSLICNTCRAELPPSAFDLRHSKSRCKKCKYKASKHRVPQGSASNPVWKSELLDCVLAAIDEGLSYKDIARRLGMTKNQISGAMWRHGIQPRKQEQGRPIVTMADRLDALHVALDAVTNVPQPKRRPPLPQEQNFLRSLHKSPPAKGMPLW
jgi:transposase-like protein